MPFYLSDNHLNYYFIKSKSFRFPHKSVRFIEESFRFSHKSVRFFEESFRFSHKSVRLLGKSFRFSHKSVRLLGKSFRFSHKSVRFRYHSVRFPHKSVYPTGKTFYFHDTYTYHIAAKRTTYNVKLLTYEHITVNFTIPIVFLLLATILLKPLFIPTFSPGKTNIGTPVFFFPLYI